METATVRGVELAYEVSGAGPHLIWGHGLTSSMESEQQFSLLRWKKLQPVVTVIRYDARGHGLSGSTPDPEGYHWEQLALDQLALADGLGIDSYVAAGASMGCATALYAAVLAPARIRALLLVIPPTAWETRAAQKTAYDISADLVESGDIDALVAASKTAPAPDPLSQFPEWRSGAEASMRAADPVRLSRVFRGAARTDLPAPDEVAAVAVPTLVLAWSGDPGHPDSTAVRLGELIPHASVHVASTFDDLRGWTTVAAEFLGSI